MRRVWKRWLSVVMSVAILVTAMPSRQILAAEAGAEADVFAQEAAKDLVEQVGEGVEVLPASFPEDLEGAEEGGADSFYVIGNGQVDVAEKGKYAITVYRLGNTSKASTVAVKSVDYSALYGKDYAVSDMRFETEVHDSEKTLLEQTAEKENMEAGAAAVDEMLKKNESYIESADPEGDEAEQGTGTEAGEAVQSADANAGETTQGTGAETAAASSDAGTDADAGAGLNAAADASSTLSLAELKQAQTGNPTRETTDDTEQAEALMGLADLITQNGVLNAGDHLEYSSVTRISFAPGETEKQLVFEILEDDESEGDELIQFIITDPEGNDLVLEPNMATIVIRDDEPAERSAISFSAASYEADGDAAKVTLVREGGSYNMVTLTFSVSGRGRENDYMVKEIGFSPYQMENEIDLSFKQGDEPMDYDLSIRDIKGGDAGAITEASLHVEAKADTFLAPVVGGDEADGLKSLGDPDGEVLESVGHNAAQDGSEIKIHDIKYDLVAYPASQLPGAYRIMTKPNDRYYDRKHPVQVGVYYSAACPSVFSTAYMFNFGDSPHRNYNEWNGGGQFMHLEWYSRVSWDEGGAGQLFRIGMRPYSGVLIDYTALSNWDSCKTHFYTEGAYSGLYQYGMKKALEVKRCQNGPDDYTIENREFMGPIRFTAGEYHEKGGRNSVAGAITDAGKVPNIGNGTIQYGVSTGKYAHGLLNPTAHIYGAACMYKSVKFTLVEPSKMKYLRADGSYVSEYPARVNAPDSHERYYDESITFDVEQQDSDINVPKGKITAWEITPKNGTKFTVTRDDVNRGRASYISRDMLTFTVNGDFIDALTANGQQVTNSDLDYTGYRMNISVKPVFDYIPVHVKVIPSDGNGSFASSNISAQKEYTFHVGDTIDLSGKPDTGWYYRGYSMTTYKNYDDTHAKMDAPVVLSPLKLKLSNEESYVIRPVFTREANHIEVILNGDAARYFEIQGLCSQNELPDYMKGKNILKIDNRANDSDPAYLPVAGDAYEIRLVNKNNNTKYRPVFLIKYTGQRVDGYVADIIAGAASERNVIQIDAQEVDPAHYMYYELNSKAVYSSAKLRNADGEKTVDPACDVEVKVGGRPQTGYDSKGKETQIIYRSSAITETDGSFTITGFQAVPGDTVSVSFNNGDRQQVKYIKLPGVASKSYRKTYDYSKLIPYFYPMLTPEYHFDPGIAPSKRTFNVIEADKATKSMKVVEKKDMDTYVVNADPMGMPIISPRSPEVTKLTYEYDADAMRDTTKNMVELRPEETIKVRVEVNEKEAGVSGVKFILYDKDGKEKEKTEEGGGTQDGVRDSSGYYYTANFTADKGLMPGDTLYVQLVGSQYKTITLSDGSKQKEYMTYPRLNSGLVFGDVIERADPQTFTIQPAVGDYMKDIPFIGNTGDGMMANSGSITFKKTYVDPSHQDTSPFYLTVGLSLSVQEMKKQKNTLDEMRNGKHEAAKAAQDEQFTVKEKVERMDPYAEADENERTAFDRALSLAPEGDRANMRQQWESGQKEKIQKQLKKQQLSDSLAKLDENNGSAKIKKPSWDIKLIVMFNLEFAYDADSNDYYFAGGQYLFGGSFSYQRVWHTLAVVVPVYFAMQHEVSITWDGQWVTDATRKHYAEIQKADKLEDQLKTKWPWMTIGYKGKFMPGIGIYGILSARGEIKFGISVRFAAGVEKGPSGGLLLTLAGGVAIDLIGLNFSMEIAKLTVRTGVYDPKSLESSGAAEDVEQYQTYKLVPLQLSGDEVSYMGRGDAGEDALESAGLGFEPPANIEDQMILAKDVAEYVRPSVVECADGTLFMTYLKKVDGTARLYYSVDKGNGFGEAKPVDNTFAGGMDTTNDLLYKDGKVYVTWTHAEKQAGATVEEDEEGNVTVSVKEAQAALQSMNLKFAVYDTGTETMSAALDVTNDKFLNENASLYAEGDKVVLNFYKKDISKVESIEELVSQKGNYSTWARAAYDTKTKKFDLVSSLQAASPMQYEFIEIENSEYSDPLVLDYESAVYTTKDSHHEWRMSLYTVDADLNDVGYDARVEGVDTVDAQIWLAVTDAETGEEYPHIKLAEGNVTNAQLNVVGDNVLLTWLEDAQTLYTISAEGLFHEDDDHITDFEHYANGQKLKVQAVDEGRLKTEETDYEINVSTATFAEDEDSIVNLSQYRVVAGKDDNVYLFTLAPGSGSTLAPGEEGEDSGQELWGASYYSGTDEGKEYRERIGWGKLTQITDYGVVIDEMAVAVNKDHNATILANMYKNTVDDDGLTSGGYQLVRLDCKPVTSLAFSREPHFDSENTYPLPGEEVSIEFSLVNEGLLPARRYDISLYRIQGGEKNRIGVVSIIDENAELIFTGEEREYSFNETIPESIEGLSYKVEVSELDADGKAVYGTKEAVLEVAEGVDVEEWTDARTVAGSDILDSFDALKRIVESYGHELSEEEMEEAADSLNIEQAEDVILIVTLTQEEDMNKLVKLDLAEYGIVPEKMFAVAYLYNAGNIASGKIQGSATLVSDGTRGEKLGESKVIESIPADDFQAVVVPIDTRDGALYNDMGVFNVSFDITIDGKEWENEISLLCYTPENVGISREDGKEALDIVVGDCVSLGLAAHPFSKRAELHYVSDNTEVATVSEDGMVTGIGRGECAIYAYDYSAENNVPVKKIVIKVDSNPIVQYLKNNYLNFADLENDYMLYLLKGGTYVCDEGLKIETDVNKAVKYNAKKHIFTPKKSCVLTLTLGDQTKKVNLRVMTLKKKNVTFNSRRTRITMAEIFTNLDIMMPDVDGSQFLIGGLKDKNGILMWDGDISTAGFKTLNDFAVNATGKKGKATITAVFGGKLYKATVKCDGFPVKENDSGHLVQNLAQKDAKGNRVLTFDSVGQYDTLLLLKSGKYALEDGLTVEPMGANYKNAIKIKKDSKSGVRKLVLKKEAPVKLIKTTEENGATQTLEKFVMINFVNVKNKGKVTLKAGEYCTLADAFPEAYELLPDPSDDAAYGGYSIKISDSGGVLGIDDGTFPGNAGPGWVQTLGDFLISHAGKSGKAKITLTFGGKKYKASVKCK